MLYEPCQFVVSNEVPDHPCVSPSSNCVFERRLIEKYIAENGTDPISGEQLSEEQLIDIKGNLRHIKVTSFHGGRFFLLFSFHFCNLIM